MKYSIVKTTRFKKGMKRMLKRGKQVERLEAVVKMLAAGETLPERYCDHALTGDLSGLRDCHIEPDWVLVYYREDEKLVLSLTDTGTHSDLF